MNVTLRSFIADRLAAGDDRDQIIDAVIAMPEFAEFAHRLVAATVANQARAMVRDHEHQVDAALAVARTAQDRAAARRQLIGDTFLLPDGTAVRWLEATAEQHDARAEWLESHAAAVMATADRHRVAAAEIRAAGVSCLADLDEVAA